jgi:hypothetical protein
MFKIAICGKAKSGKNTLAHFIVKQLKLDHYAMIAFADPIKRMIKKMYPNISNEILWGSSEMREQVIQYALKDNKPLTIRQLLCDLGDFGRQYNENIWIMNFENEYINKNTQAIICPDVRFRNEFTYLKSQGFFMIRILRSDCMNLTHVSEKQQEQIKNNEFDVIINNNVSLEQLIIDINNNIIPKLKNT